MRDTNTLKKKNEKTKNWFRSFYIYPSNYRTTIYIPVFCK